MKEQRFFLFLGNLGWLRFSWSLTGGNIFTSSFRASEVRHTNFARSDNRESRVWWASYLYQRRRVCKQCKDRVQASDPWSPRRPQGCGLEGDYSTWEVGKHGYLIWDDDPALLQKLRTDSGQQVQKQVRTAETSALSAITSVILGDVLPYQISMERYTVVHPKPPEQPIKPHSTDTRSPPCHQNDPVGADDGDGETSISTRRGVRYHRNYACVAPKQSPRRLAAIEFGLRRGRMDFQRPS